MPRLSDTHRRSSWFLAGPTASGKSAVAMKLIHRLRDAGQHPEIVALDSMTLYRGMDIGTAKPTLEDRRTVPHHLFDILNIDEGFTAAEYVVRAARVCDEILGRNGVPIFVGGTGLYLRSLLRGVFDGPPADSEIRDRLKKEAAEFGSESLHARLRDVDPASGDRLPINDLRRIIRALEVYELTGKTLTSWQQQEQPDTIAQRVFWLEPDRAELHRRINARVDVMLEEGWLQEAADLLAGERTVGQTAQQALGYQELFAVIQDGAELPEMIERIKARTRQFAKRQHTWFRNLAECQAVCVAPSDDADDVALQILQIASGDKSASSDVVTS